MTEAAPQRLTALTFTRDRTRKVLEAACRQLPLDPAGATVLRHHTNAVYRLAASPVVVKIARPDIRHAPAIVQLTRWIADRQVPSVPLLDDIDQPVEIAGCAITFWRYLPQTRPLVAADIAGPLAALHNLPPPPLHLPDFDPILAIQRSLAATRGLHDDEQLVLRERCADLAGKFAALRFERPHVLLHGDPQHRNALWDDDAGRAVLCDWESAVFGPPEWDLTTIEIHCRRFGHDATEYRDFWGLLGFLWVCSIPFRAGFAVVKEIGPPER